MSFDDEAPKPPKPLFQMAGLFAALGVDLSSFGHEDEPARGSFEVEEFEDIKTAVAAFETALAKAQSYIIEQRRA